MLFAICECIPHANKHTEKKIRDGPIQVCLFVVINKHLDTQRHNATVVAVDVDIVIGADDFLVVGILCLLRLLSALFLDLIAVHVQSSSAVR